MKTEAYERVARARVGATVRSKWRLDALLGVSGSTALYAATHRNGRRASLEILHANLAADDDAQHRFLSASYAANRVGHTGAVATFDDDYTDDGCPYVVLEPLEGQTLRARRLGAGGRLRPAILLPILDDVLCMLAAAHDHDIVHGDIRAANIFLTVDGCTRLFGFGAAAARVDRARAEPRTDLWGVGATAYHGLTGRAAPGESDAPELARRSRQAAPALLSEAPETHPAIARLVDKALAADPDDRWSSARHMQRWLRRALAAQRERDHRREARATSIPPGPHAPLSSGPVPASDPVPWSDGRRLLIVEDEPALRRALRRILVADGFSVEDCGSAEEALESLRTRAHDLLLADVNLPGLSGLDLLRRARDLGLDLVTAIMTAAVSQEVISEALSLGAMDFIPKPFRNLSALPDRLAGLIERQAVSARFDLVAQELALVAEGNRARRSDAPHESTPSPIGFGQGGFVVDQGAPLPTLVIGDDDSAALLRDALAGAVCLRDVPDASSALEALAGPNAPLVVVAPLRTPNLLRHITEIRLVDPSVEVLVVGTDRNEEAALASLDAGASDFMLRTDGDAVIVSRVRRLLGRAQLKRMCFDSLAASYTAAARVDGERADTAIACLPLDAQSHLRRLARQRAHVGMRHARA